MAAERDDTDEASARAEAALGRCERQPEEAAATSEAMETDETGAVAGEAAREGGQGGEHEGGMSEKARGKQAQARPPRGKGGKRKHMKRQDKEVTRRAARGTGDADEDEDDGFEVADA